MSKTLEQLFDKARKNGESNKNGRIVERDFGHVYKGELREQWHVIDNAKGFELRHWGTTILSLDNHGGIIDVYGESSSDRDALNQAFDYLNTNCHAHFYPSRSELEIHINGTDELMKTI